MREDIQAIAEEKNNYTKKKKQQVTMNINVQTVEYFKQLSAESGIPYQTLINLYLDECVRDQKRIKFISK